ncbi:MAG TPA: SDR family NAD(P)-dependent oxidoreductase, partial [Burkholderiales bacterium]|nr:SDR family NAD(P)-dependent oxidoreductase [Burkholderiales bacterium]
MTEIAVVVGVGPGLGSALARRFAQAGMSVAVAARHPDRLQSLAKDLGAGSGKSHVYSCDATDEQDVERLFAEVERNLGTPNLVVFNAGAFVHMGILETPVEEFERCWRVGCLGGFLVGRAAARAMLARIERGGPGGTLLFTGATASLRGSARFHNLAVGKFGLRALAQSMARELQPRGIHVAHVVIDG